MISRISFMPEVSRVRILKVCFQRVVFSQAKELRFRRDIIIFDDSFLHGKRSHNPCILFTAFQIREVSVECKCCMISPAKGRFSSTLSIGRKWRHHRPELYVGKAGACAGSWLLCLELRGYSPHSLVVRLIDLTKI